MGIMRQKLRDEFPRGWWRSPRWWWAGLKDLVAKALASITPVLLAGQVARAVKHRDRPEKLAKLDGEAYVVGLVLNVIVIVVLIQQSIGIGESPATVDEMLVLLTFSLTATGLNAITGLVAVLVLWRSRRRDRVWWSMRDYVFYHGVESRPPETIAEYRAERMRHSLED